MKKLMTLLAFSVALSPVCEAQYWERQASGVSTVLQGVFFISPTQGWVVGSSGVILATVDGGATWTPQVSPAGSAVHLRAVYFTSSTKGWIVGDTQTLLTTENGGGTWTDVTTSAGSAYYDVFFTSPDTGYIVGGSGVTGEVQRTTNGGQTWAITSLDRVLKSVYFTAHNKGWACGDRGVIYRTTNGVSWTQQAAPGANVTTNLSAIYMLSDTVGWACGNPSSNKRTVDGGLTWTNQASGTNAGKTGIYFSDSQNGWATSTTALGGGDCPIGCPFRYTSNGGSAWVTDTLRTPSVRCMRFYSPTFGWAVGDDGWIYRFGNAGTTVPEGAVTANTIRISPNPVGDRLMLTSDEPIRAAEVFNSMGALVLTLNGGSLTSIDVGVLPPGSYAIRAITNSGARSQVERFTKE